MDKKPLIREWLVLGIILIFLGTCIVPATAQNIEKQSSRGIWLYVGGSGLGNYTRIQDAVDNASNGDTIFVYNGTYHENVLVSKSLTIIGENKVGTIIDGNGGENGMNITAVFVTIIGFTIENTKMAGVRVNANNSMISGNIIKDFSTYGIWFDFCDAHTASNNILMSGLAIGIDLLFSNHNVITNNTILLTIGGGGISLYTSSNNTVQSNHIDKGNCPIAFSSNNNSWLNNSMKQSLMYFYGESNDNVLVGNFFNESGGLDIRDSYGSSCGNKIYHNHFIDCGAQDACCNSWDNGYPSGGNYWYDYTDNDYNQDGIGDSAYNIYGGNNVDQYPLGYFDYEPPVITIMSPEKGFVYFRLMQLLPLNNPNATLFLGDMVFCVNVSDNYLIDVYFITVYVNGKEIGGYGGLLRPYTFDISRRELNQRFSFGIFNHKYEIRFEAVDHHKNQVSKEMIVWSFL